MNARQLTTKTKSQSIHIYFVFTYCFICDSIAFCCSFFLTHDNTFTCMSAWRAWYVLCLHYVKKNSVQFIGFKPTQKFQGCQRVINCFLDFYSLSHNIYAQMCVYGVDAVSKKMMGSIFVYWKSKTSIINIVQKFVMISYFFLNFFSIAIFLWTFIIVKPDKSAKKSDMLSCFPLPSSVHTWDSFTFLTIKCRAWALVSQDFRYHHEMPIILLHWISISNFGPTLDIFQLKPIFTKIRFSNIFLLSPCMKHMSLSSIFHIHFVLSPTLNLTPRHYSCPISSKPFTLQSVYGLLPLSHA